PEVVGPWIGRIDRRTRRAGDRGAVGLVDAVGTAAAPIVVGQRAVDLARPIGVGGDPLRAVHHRGADDVCCLARIDQDVGLVGEAGGRVEPVLAVHQGNPLAGTGELVRVRARLELRDIKDSGVEDVRAGRRVGGIVDAFADELVYVFV